MYERKKPVGCPEDLEIKADGVLIFCSIYYKPDDDKHESRIDMEVLIDTGDTSPMKVVDAMVSVAEWMEKVNAFLATT